jgi:ArsR family transcriptional regulator, arsenate/arsenite/antimonite-responsive transcriptional repressor
MAKNDLFDEALQRKAQYFKVLSHPARLAILQYLVETGTCMTGDITDELPLSRTTVGQHLSELKDCGLIQGTVEGVKVNYCIHPDGLDAMMQVLNEMMAVLLKSKCCKC